ncbi:hypothetical protein Val02_91560 [Virgisporangium aliadipatigenens]|uniref:Uncharacterized protein n=2 Tax=Virgisporangium aliadipatigenens TaxID=741659 RepID=A0A8J4DVC9_9ACTN|nr:hypothetical protein Val02_91560 [Virgisporangium aliadipatigenens]
MPPTVIEPALLAHAFFTADGTSPSEGGRADLRRLWDGIVGLALDSQIPGMPATLQDAVTGGFTGRLTVLGARRSADGADQLVVYQDHDIVGASLLLAPDPPGATWIGLQRRWEAALDGAPVARAAIGSAVVYIGQTDIEVPAHNTLQQLVPLLPAAEGMSPATAGFHRGIRLGELPPSGDGPVACHRRLVAVAPPAEKDTLDRWLWSDDVPGLVPLTRYLLHAAKLRYQQWILVRDLPAVRAATAAARTDCDRLVGDVQRPMPPERLRATSERLTLAQSRERGLVDSLSRIRIMTGTVRTAERNMRSALDTPTADEPGSPLDNDRHIAAWLSDQLGTEEIYLQATNERVSQVLGVVAAAVDNGQKLRYEALAVLQTSLLGGLVTALAAIQTLRYELPIRPSLTAPLVAALTALAVLVPTAILHWPPGSRRGHGWRLLDALLFGCAGATLGWLVIGIAGSVINGAAPSWHWTLPIAVTAGLSAAALPWLAGRD